MNNKPKTKLLTISLLCCGRPDTTEACLKSLMPLRERIDSEIQVVDTGCSAETRAIIEKYADEVFDFTWCNDFSAARNCQLEHANGEWFLYLDDDEYFEVVDELLELFTSDNHKKYSYGGYIQRNYVEPDGSEYRDVRVGRLTRIKADTEFRGKVHEYIANESGDAIFLGDYVGHYGYCYNSEEDNIKHAKRNIPLLIEMMKEEPEEYRWPYQLAQEYRACKEFKKLYQLMKSQIEKLSGNLKQDEKRYLSSFVCGRAIAQEALGLNDELTSDYEMLLDSKYIFENAKARVSIYAARIYKLKEDFDKCERACLSFLKYADYLKGNPAQSFLQDGIFMNDTFDENHFNIAYSYLIICGFSRDDIGPLMEYYEKITWERKYVSIDPGMITGLIVQGYENGNEAGINKVFDKCFCRPALKSFIEAEVRRTSVLVTKEDLTRLLDCFTNTQYEKEMKLFTKIRILENECVRREWACFVEVRDIVENYNALLEEWFILHDKELDHSADSTDETADLKLSRKLMEFFNRCDGDAKEAMKLLKSVVGLVPVMDSTIQNISRLFSDRQRVSLAREENPKKFEEMFELEKAVRLQISELENTGHGADAATTRVQLESILMQTYGVKSLY